MTKIRVSRTKLYTINVYLHVQQSGMILEIRSPFKVKRADLQTKSEAVVTVGTISGLQYWESVSNEIRKLITGLSSNLVRLDCTTAEGQTDAFSRCAPVASVVGRMAEYSMNARYSFVDKEGKDVKASGPLSVLMNQPNPFQSWSEFIATVSAFVKLYGQAYILPVVPEGFDVTAAKRIWVIPNYMVTPHYSNKFIYQDTNVSGYKVTGLSGMIQPEHMLIIRDSMPFLKLYETQRIFEGNSRLSSLSDTVNNLIAIQDALYASTVARGAMGAWVPEGRADGTGMQVPLDDKDRDQVLEDFNQYGPTTGHKSMFMVMRYGLKWVQAAMNIGDLKLFEGHESGVQSICMAYNFPMPLVGLKDQSSTYNNLQTAEKSIYTNAIIPLVENIVSKLSAFFGYTDIQLKCFFDHLEVFQKSKKDEADALKSMVDALNTPFTNNIITMEEYRSMMSNFMPSGVPFDAEKPYGQTYFKPQSNE